MSAFMSQIQDFTQIGGRPKQKANRTSQRTGAANTVKANDLLANPSELAAPSRAAHHFNAPDAEAVLGLRRLLIKVVGASHIPESAGGSRRSCSAEVQLVTASGEPLPSSTLHVRTGPPNHFSTVKDTAPVWNAEYVAELVGDAFVRGGALRFDVWDEAVTPPIHIGDATIMGSDMLSLNLREEERSVPLYRTSTGQGGTPMPAGQLKVRLSYIDVRAGMVSLAQAMAVATESSEQQRRAAEEVSTAEAQLGILAKAVREEEDTVAFLRSDSVGPLGGHAGAAQREREEARVRKAHEASPRLKPRNPN